jgi:hypothetical protein
MNMCEKPENKKEPEETDPDWYEKLTQNEKDKYNAETNYGCW